MAQHYTITGDLNALTGTLDLSRRRAVITSNLPPNAVVVDKTNKTLHVGTGEFPIPADGVISVSLLESDATDTNVTGIEYWLETETVLPILSNRNRRSQVTEVKLGPFKVTKNANLADADMVAQFETPATAPAWRDGFKTEMEAVKTLAQTIAAAEADRAEAAADLATDISNIATPDGVVAALIPLGGAATAALCAAMGDQIADPATPAGQELAAVGLRVAPAGTASANRAAVQAAITSAALFGAPVLLRGTFSVDAALVPASGSIIDGTGAHVTVSANLTTLFSVVNKNRVTIRGLRADGKRTDYVNTSSVYAATAVFVSGTSSTVTVESCDFRGFAGAGVRIEGTADLVRVTGCRLEGPGAAHILNNTYNYGSGVVVATSGRWSVEGCDISEYAQGVVTGDGLSDARIVDNWIHHIRGQHGAYIESVDRLVFQSNIVANTALCGVKVQVGTTTSPDPQDISIANNIFDTCGAQGVLLTNPPGGTPRLRRVSVTGNVINAAARGVEANNTIGLHVADNSIYNSASQGISLNSCSQFDLTDNRIQGTVDQGLLLNVCSDGEVNTLRVIDPASGNSASTEYGVLITGACSDLSLLGVRVTDSAGNMRYGVYSSPASGQETFSFRDIFTTGASDYGVRLQTATAVREWRNIDANGAMGKVLTAPTAGRGQRGSDSFAAALPTSGGYVVPDRIWNIAPAAGGHVGWVCTTAGTAVSAAWVASTAYTLGTVRSNGANVYEVITAGTSAASGGPTGSTLSIVDGTVTWKFLSPLAVFKPFGAISA